jgi:glutamate-ammonia-ligase adenylyltransferase
MTSGPDVCFGEIIETLGSISLSQINFESLATLLRQAKRQAALTIAVADISNHWDLMQVTAALTELAEWSLQLACQFGLTDLANKGAITLNNPSNPEEGSGLIVFGMGKLGAGELNYSSDIDIIVLFDPDRIQTDRPDELQKYFIRLTRSLVKLLDERTADGYVFRTDLRLRPDPSSTPVAISIDTARTYYASRARNWERAAFIKARAVAGDIAAGEDFLRELQTFIWKSDLDFSAVRDMQIIKRQIDEHKNSGALQVLGHNVKLGRGGIREIEFIAQAQQLVWGGRKSNFRGRKTIEMLQLLADEEKISKSQSDGLIYAYQLLRRVEHRIQMINDEQTHSLPTDEEGLNEFALFMGFEDLHAFEKSLLAQLEFVDDAFVHQFEISLLPAGKEDSLNLSLYQKEEPDASTLSIFENMGFSDPSTVFGAVSNWISDDQISEKTQKNLAELLPVILNAFGG